MKASRRKIFDWSRLVSLFGVKTGVSKKGIRYKNIKRISTSQKRWVQ